MRLLMICIVGFFLLNTSCKNKGCTNPYCETYEPKAKKDDGSCGCQDGAVSIYMTKDYGELTVVLNNDTVGKLVDYFPDEIPKCGQAGTLTLELSPGSYTLDAKSVLGNTWQKQITITEKNCNLLLLE